MPLYSFGYGLSYTRFKYSDLQISPKKFRTNENVSINVKVKVENVGEYNGDEVVQLYINKISSSRKIPIRSLNGFKRIHLKKGEAKKVEFSLTSIQFSKVDDSGKNILEPGRFLICVGGCQEGFSVFKDDIIKDTIEIY
jgi:beta-glucosidase